MTGLTVGPRQFTMMKDYCGVKMAGGEPGSDDFEAGGSDWVMVGKYVYNQTKLDLRPFYQANKTRALDMLNITLQESGPLANGSPTVGIYIVDILSTVRLSRNTIQRNLYLNTSGFLNTTPVEYADLPSRQKLSPSQITWGLWRHFDHDANVGGAVVMRASSYFGEGEIIVAPALYWTRIVSQYHPSEGSWTIIPSSNLVCHAAAINISEGQELAQMSRLAQA